MQKTEYKKPLSSVKKFHCGRCGSLCSDPISLGIHERFCTGKKPAQPEPATRGNYTGSSMILFPHQRG